MQCNNCTLADLTIKKPYLIPKIYFCMALRGAQSQCCRKHILCFDCLGRCSDKYSVFVGQYSARNLYVIRFAIRLFQNLSFNKMTNNVNSILIL